MKGVSTAFWSIVLIGSTVSIGAGFVGGRSIGSAGSLAVAHNAGDGLPPPISKQQYFQRALTGTHSLDAATPSDPYGDPEFGVTERPRSANGFDPRTDRAKIAVVVVDVGSGGLGLSAFVQSPLPLTLAVSPDDENAAATIAAIAAAGKTVVVDGAASQAAQVAPLLRDGANGVIASLDESRAAAFLRAIDRNAFVIDASLNEDDVLSSAARSLHRRVYVRDLTADARDDARYVDFMLRDALAIAQRTGSAIVAVHARRASLDAITRFADRASRDGADIVALTELGN